MSDLEELLQACAEGVPASGYALADYLEEHRKLKAAAFARMYARWPKALFTQMTRPHKRDWKPALLLLHSPIPAVWHTADKRVIPVEQMLTRHLKNAIKFLVSKSHGFHGLVKQCMEEELELRVAGAGTREPKPIEVTLEDTL